MVVEVVKDAMEVAIPVVVVRALEVHVLMDAVAVLILVAPAALPEDVLTVVLVPPTQE